MKTQAQLPKVGSVVRATYKPKHRSYRMGQPTGLVIDTSRTFIMLRIPTTMEVQLCSTRIYDFETLVHVSKEGK